MIHEAPWWSLESAGWQVDVSDDSTAFTPGDAEAALVISAFRKVAGSVSPEELWVMSGKASPPSAPRSSAQCGDFHGYQSTYVADGAHWRVWWLAHEAIHVYATFNCQPEDAGKHDAVLDWMLSSLRAASYAG